MDDILAVIVGLVFGLILISPFIFIIWKYQKNRSAKQSQKILEIIKTDTRFSQVSEIYPVNYASETKARNPFRFKYWTSEGALIVQSEKVCFISTSDKSTQTIEFDPKKDQLLWVGYIGFVYQFKIIRENGEQFLFATQSTVFNNKQNSVYKRLSELFSGQMPTNLQQGNLQDTGYSSSWFYAIAALTLVNSFLYLDPNSTITFVLGLSFTQFTDGFVGILLENTILAMIISLCCAGVFAYLGYMSGKKNKAALLTGSILLILDTLFLISIIMFFEDSLGNYILDFALRGLVLFSFINSFKILSLQDKQTAEAATAT